MNSSPAGWFKVVCGYLFVGSVGFMLVSAAGCASKMDGVSIGGGRSEIVTDSDEPEVRRRARIRLELAVGYFEQGQTTIALDELKQSLATDPDYAEAYSLRGLIKDLSVPSNNYVFDTAYCRSLLLPAGMQSVDSADCFTGSL